MEHVNRHCRHTLTHLCYRLKAQEGSVIVIVAVALVALVGLVALATDVGSLYLAKQRASVVADAAALSGAQFLPYDPPQAMHTAEMYLDKNGVKATKVTLSYDSTEQSLSVEVTGDVAYTFARVLGQEHGQVQAAAVARATTISGYNGIVPFGVQKDDWRLGQQVGLKAAAGNKYSPGNFGGLALGGRGAATYENNLRSGYLGWIRVGDMLTTEPGNMAGPTDRALQYRIDQDPHATFDAVRKDSPRIVIVPIIESFDVKGRAEVKCIGFGAFFLEKLGGKGTVTGRFLRIVLPGESASPGADYGTYSIKLIR